ncbi:MAG: cation diffusion facilitator family transporter [Eubacteriales bacterium]|nr:cation diffusion facilitator family transporter [Christensenellaceae bacterium]MDD7092639.1 cation diffusion facilitator family transporter [Christensenellaceae bacterium]MDY3241731.1 cation diffusion facilitator family transporter [Eubacteriales bacterium]MDY4709884.1 cation diffusion facilitator family transporter [Eubacteriales bacterium]MDY6077764.1 cation diffusion facilitator family transporter [Eubacteriales bacterium]
MKLFKKLFIKDYQNTSDPEVRFRYGIAAGVFGIVSNTVLCVFKILVGILSGSVAIVADAVNNLSDAASSIVTVFGFKLSNRPADREHPYGHERYEYIAAFIIAFAVVLIGALLLKQSIEKIITPEGITVSVYTYVVLAVAIVLKIVQGLLYRDFGKSINSEALRASAADSRNDVFTTIAVLISTIVIDTTGVNIDGYAGLVVSIVIIVFSLKLLKDTVNPLLGTVPDKALVGKIAEKLSSYEVVLGFHDLMIHSYGPAITYASVHVEVDAKENVIEMHDAIDNIERDFMNDMNVHLVIHMDPVTIGDPETDNLKSEITGIIKNLNGDLTLHDFRLVKGPTHTNVLFDVVIPYDCKTTLGDIKRALQENVKSETTYYYVINVDRKFTD